MTFARPSSASLSSSSLRLPKQFQAYLMSFRFRRTVSSPFFFFLFLLFCTIFFVLLHIAFLFRVSGGGWRSIVLSVLYVFIYLRFSRIHVEPFHLGPCLLTSTHIHFNLGALRKWRTERGYSTPPSAMVQSQTSATHSLSYRPVCERIVVFNKRDLVSEWGIEVRIIHALILFYYSCAPLSLGCIPIGDPSILPISFPSARFI